MNYRKAVYITFLCAYFIFYWLYINRNVLPTVNEEGIPSLFLIVTSYAAYNAIGLHGTIYSLFFIFMLNEFLPKMNAQYMLRMKRNKFLCESAKKVFLSSLIFTFIVISIETLLVSIFVNEQILSQANFYNGIILLFFLMFLYYVFVGVLFLFLTVLFSKAKAYVVSFALLTFLVCYPSLFSLPIYWLPVEITVVFDLMFRAELHWCDVCLEIIKIIAFTVFIYCLTVIIFRDKDIINEDS